MRRPGTSVRAHIRRGPAGRRVAIWRDVDLPVFAGRLRHELEHARQWDRFGRSIFELYDLIRDELLPRKAGDLNGCAGMYVNAIPAEQDANAARRDVPSQPPPFSR
jgi:hypothetical protein